MNVFFLENLNDYEANILKNLDDYFFRRFILGNFLRLVFNYVGVVLLISMVFLSIPQQVLPSTEHTILLACSETLTETYPNLNFSTYLGGSDGEEIGYGIAVAEDGSCYVTGHTDSNDFPTQNAFNSTYSGNRDAIVAKFNSSGSLLWSTFLGGNSEEEGSSIAVTSDGSCYVIGIC